MPEGQKANCRNAYAVGEEGVVGEHQDGQDIRERTFQFAVRVVRLCQYLDDRPGPSRTLGRQLIRSGTSIGANLEEAKAGHTKKEFIYKCGIALKEARETHYWLRLLAAADVKTGSLLTGLQDECDELRRIIGAIIVAARQNPR